MPQKGKKTSGRCLDTSTVATEEHWYSPEAHWDQVRSFCKSWQGSRDLQLVSVFDRSKKMCMEWTRHHHSAEAFDIAHDEVNHDAVTQVGFFVLLALLMRLAPGGLSMWAPPCSLFIFLTSSLHLRHVYGCQGDVSQYSIRLANRISMNACMALRAVLKFRPDCHVMAEQPSGSWLFKSHEWQATIAGFYLRKTLTYQGLFGGPIPKATHIVHSFRTDALFARKLTRAMREKKFNKDRLKVFYIKDAKGGVQGTKMLTRTSVYPAGFVKVLFKAWMENAK